VNEEPIAPDLRRRFYAEEIQAVANIQGQAVVEALASIERERFLPPGPWAIRSEGDFMAPMRRTADADPRHVYHNVAIGLDPARMLFNGAPSAIAGAIDSLRLAPGDRVLHIGTGLGYYTALMATCVGATGRVLGVEVDPNLAAGARDNLRDMDWVEVRHGDASEPFVEVFDAILVNAGVTHPLHTWLEALSEHGRMIVPVTATIGPVATIGKGQLLLVSATEHRDRWAVRPAGFVAIYSAVGIRSETVNAALGQAFSRMPFAPVKSLRRDAHDPDETCWVHAPGICLSLR
jgi:protein-L-isoaspartate(D-aspartate) O-methyltransferase